MRKLKTSELDRLSVREFKDSKKWPVVIVLDNIRSLHNIGSIFRTADAFLVKAIYLCGITAKPPHREIRKTALGATESVTWQYFKDTKSALRSLSKDNYHLIAIEQAEGSLNLQDFSPPADQPIALVFGNEVHGVDDEIINTVNDVVEIPQLGTKHSFNVAVSVGIVVWDLWTKRNELS